MGKSLKHVLFQGYGQKDILKQLLFLLKTPKPGTTFKAALRKASVSYARLQGTTEILFTGFRWSRQNVKHAYKGSKTAGLLQMPEKAF